ncbi:hypothetical protein SFK315_1258 [Shigella flexneri K-315]|uniref:Insertion element IS1 protein InsA helix-turn-helix domain-containing protein n=1 Tax=Shigella flexneri K-315 TaxID=766150 RepID=I6CX67_SHIFL|nr:hypothetical protein SFK315_1258 [Shigella flexneri K-315]
MAMNGVGCRASARIMGVGLNTVLGLVWMTDGWPLYESRLKGKLTRYQQALHSAH